MLSTCNIVGNLLDSGLTVLDATLEVAADAPIFDDGTIPDSIILPAPRTFTITDGVVDIELLVSETSQTAYTFKLSAEGYFKEWSASIPDQAEVEFASIFPTSFTTDRSVTGAIRIAKEMLTNAAIVPYLVEGVGIIKQSSTPGEPDANSVIWFNTSNGLWYTWNPSVSKWESEVRVLIPGQIDVSSNLVMHTPIPGLPGTGSLVITNVIFRYNVQAAPNDGTNHWSLQAGYRQASSTTPTNIGSAQLTDQVGYTPGTVKELILTPNTVLDLDAAEFVRLGATKVGSPSNLNVSASFVMKFYGE